MTIGICCLLYNVLLVSDLPRAGGKSQSLYRRDPKGVSAYIAIINVSLLVKYKRTHKTRCTVIEKYSLEFIS